jgi:ketosteroid isomerase-like protein
MRAAWGIAVLVFWAGAGFVTPRTEQAGPAATELRTLVETERAFVRRAQETNWRDAFLEYFADGITGFEGEDVKERLRSRPAPPKELEFWWEPRFGDIAASGDLGWLTGPVRTHLPQANGGKPDFANYASVWKRQADGSYKVIEDVGISTPDMVPFAPGFTRAPVPSRYAGAERGSRAKGSLTNADRRLTAALITSQADAYAAAAAPFARLHRQREMPVVGANAIAAWARTRQPWTSGETQLAEVAEAGDLGYTRGSYEQPASGDLPAEAGYCLRVWSRDAQGVWRVVLDVTQPKQTRP